MRIVFVHPIIDAIDPDWSILERDKYWDVPLGVKVAIPNMARGCPLPVPSVPSGSSGAPTACATPGRWWTKIERVVNHHGVGFFILADEEPTINRRKFREFCEELIARGLPDRIKWGINTRVTDIMRDKGELWLSRKAGLAHVSLGTEAAQLKLDQFKAIRLLREADILTETQFIVGLDNETPETLEETFRMAWDWQPDLANWAMYTPRSFTPLFQELGDKVEIFDFSKYSFVTPIMKPAAMDRATLLDRVMHNYRRFYMRKALFHYPWRGTGFRRRYLLGCLKAFARADFARTLYDPGKNNCCGPQSKARVNFSFDRTRRISEAQADDWEAAADRASRAKARRAGGFRLPNGAEVGACGGGREQMEEV